MATPEKPIEPPKYVADVTQTAPPTETTDRKAKAPGEADSEAEDGLQRNEEALRKAAEEGRIVKPRKHTDSVPVFDRGDSPPKT